VAEHIVLWRDSGARQVSALLEQKLAALLVREVLVDVGA